jgi:hypothetical protein
LSTAPRHELGTDPAATVPCANRAGIISSILFVKLLE